LPEEWKESIVVPIYRKGDCSNIEAYIFVSYLQNFIQHPAVNVNSICRGSDWVHQCGFRCIRSTTDHIFYIRQNLEKKWEYNEVVHQLFIDFK
jgi:hypothetical protein